MKTLAFFLLSLLVLAALGVSQFLIVARPEAEAFGVSLLIGTTGLVVGAFVGLLSSPFASELEKDRSHSRTTGLVGLILGYLVARITEPLMDRLFDIEGVFEDPATGHNTLLFIATLLFGFVFGYVYRQFLPRPREKKPASTAAAPAEDWKPKTIEAPSTSSPNNSA